MLILLCVHRAGQNDSQDCCVTLIEISKKRQIFLDMEEHLGVEILQDLDKNNQHNWERN